MSIENFVGQAIINAKASDYPFRHFTWSNVLGDLYGEVLVNLPKSEQYEELNHADSNYDGKIRRLRYTIGEEKGLLGEIGEVLSSEWVKFKLYEILNIKTDEGIPKVLLYRDIKGYKINPHTDSRKIATIQIYLPEEEIPDVGTEFLRKHEDYNKDNQLFKIVKKMKFAPNSGYGFAVSKNSWHSVSCVESNVVRDSLMLIYYTKEGIKKAFG